MRSTAILAPVLSLFLAAPTTSAVPPARDGAPYHIVFSRNAVSAGEQVEMKLLPPVPRGARVVWPEAMASTRLAYSATYRAPFVIPRGTPPVTVHAAISGLGFRTTVSAEIALLPSSVPGVEDCLGPGQTFSTTAGTIVPDYTPADELPQLLHSVPLDIPRSDIARGVEDHIPVVALLCRSGHVLDAYVPPSYVNVGDLQPIQHDPRLVEAAIAAVRQYVFSPAMKSGQPIATWITIPISVGH